MDGGNDEADHDIFATDVMKKKNVQLASMIEKKRLAEISQKDLLHMLEEANAKTKNLDERVQKQSSELEKLSEEARRFEFKCSKRKTKIENLTVEINKLNSKLANINQKLQNKEAELK